MQKNKSTNKEKDKKSAIPTNADLEGNDKAPGEEQGKSEKVTNKDLKEKKSMPILN